MERVFIVLDCKLCIYYEVLSTGNAIAGKERARCDFADLLFLDDVDNMDRPYPCRDISFSDYLKRKSVEEQVMVQERKIG